jgi:RNA polymerase sigma factor (sigma-70 family)
LSAVQSVAVVSNGAVPDAELVRRVRGGDDGAFEELFRRYESRIRAFVARRVGDRARAEDLTQEAFLSALRRLRATDSEIAFKPWLFQIALNATIDQHRRASRAEEVSVDQRERMRPSDRGRLVGVAGPETEALTKERMRHLQGAFDELSETHHKVLVMRELEGRSYREIGEQLELSQPAVESALFRARRRLASEFEALAAGRRCLSVLDDIASLAEGAEGRASQRRLARHARRCSSCRLRAREMGVEPFPRFAAFRSRALALAPIPLLLRRRPGSAARGEALPRGHAANLLSGPASQACATLAEGALALVSAAALAAGGSAALDAAGVRPATPLGQVGEAGIAGESGRAAVRPHRAGERTRPAAREKPGRAAPAGESPPLAPPPAAAPEGSRDNQDSGSLEGWRGSRRLPPIADLGPVQRLPVPKLTDVPKQRVALPQEAPAAKPPLADAGVKGGDSVLDLVKGQVGAG